MKPINYDGRRFKTINNTDNGEVNEETTFYYFQKDDVVWAHYYGGGIVKGQLIASINELGCLEMSYHHINENNEMMTGMCTSKPELLEDGRLRLHEEWEWTCRDYSKGKSIIEEILLFD
ncbi:n-acetylglutamate synthase [Paenibacillus sp. L3-i20]|uniref:n-acetylglutamate synthase n=1 Tax=Paenibacillus sp. L3-i20 TaxID=2905833 RepID=UPI001EDCC348|nr:n-acetylglutamate synthase [Paenibacillus sp. L3-i20]GKU79179.1 hypothetical protein L3i20_v235760 [Paenibacillus sp. L3-i20]